MGTKDQGKIVMYGMGGFLNPPTHPEHQQAVQSARGHTFSLSLSAAVDSEWLDKATRTIAKQILDMWVPLPIEHPDVQDWIHRVLGYFKNCYQAENGSWKAGELRILKRGDEPLPANLHAGVNLIRKYYPEYQPTTTDWEKAYWGIKPDAA